MIVPGPMSRLGPEARDRAGVDCGRVLLGDVDLSGHPVDIAPRILGARLVSTIGGTPVVARIVEVEAYGGVGEDPGSHAFRRQTKRNATMFAGPGVAYVYFTYGMHWCLNLVVGPEGTAGAILIRAARVIEGVDVARSRRPTARTDNDLCRGPARLTTALAITGREDGSAMVAGLARVPVDITLTAGEAAVEDIVRTPRTGVGGLGASLPWRFAVHGDAAVSPYRRAAARPSRTGDATSSGQIGP